MRHSSEGMTTLGSAVDSKPAASSLVAPCVRRLGGAFSPALDPMSDGSIDDGGGGDGGGTGGIGDDGLNDVNGRWKRELEPGGCEEQQPPPAKRVSPILRRPHSSSVATVAPGGAAAGAAAAAAAAAQYLGDAAAATPIVPAPTGRPCPSSPTCALSGGSTHAHARDNALAMSRAPSSSPSKVMAAMAGAAAVAAVTSAASSTVSANPIRATSLVADRPRSPPRLSGKSAVSTAPTANGEHPSHHQVQQQQQHVRHNSSSSAPSPLTMVGHHHHCRDILKPSPAKQNVGVGGGGLEDDVGAAGMGGGGGDGDVDSPGNNSCKGMKQTLGGGGLRAPAIWDGGSASSGQPGSGGGLSAPSAVCASCEGREPCSGDCDGKGGALRPSSMSACLSPLPFARSISTDSSGAGGGTGNHAGRSLFADNPLPYPTNGLQQSSLGVGPPLAEGGRSLSVGGGGGGGGGHGEVEDFAMLMDNDDNTNDIHACMRTLQASPAVSFGRRWQAHHTSHVTLVSSSTPFSLSYTSYIRYLFGWCRDACSERSSLHQYHLSEEKLQPSYSIYVQYRVVPSFESTSNPIFSRDL